MTLPKKIRFTFLFISAIIKNHYKIIMLGMILGISLYFITPKLLKYFPEPAETIKIGIVGQYQINNLPNNILEDISYGLTVISDNGEPKSGLAESWSVEDGGKTYVFKLKTDNIYWHDGKILSAGDISYNFKDIDFSVIQNNLIFKLKEPFSPLPVILAKPIFKKGLIGFSKYRVKKIVNSGKFISLISLTAYDKKSGLPNKYYRFYNNENDLKTAFNLGEINQMDNLFNINNITTGSRVKIAKEIMKNAYIAVFFNTNNPLFASKTFRQALSYAIPKETGLKRALTPIGSDSWVYNPDVKPYTQDLAHSLSLLKAENIDTGNLVINIGAFSQFENIANQIKENWQQVGIKSAVRIVNSIPENFEVLIIAREIPKDPDQYFIWHSTQPGNISFFKNLRIDKLLEDGRRQTDKEERKNTYFDFQRFLTEETPAIFLTHPEVYRVTRE